MNIEEVSSLIGGRCCWLWEAAGALLWEAGFTGGSTLRRMEAEGLPAVVSDLTNTAGAPAAPFARRSRPPTTPSPYFARRSRPPTTPSPYFTRQSRPPTTPSPYFARRSRPPTTPSPYFARQSRPPTTPLPSLPGAVAVLEARQLEAALALG